MKSKKRIEIPVTTHFSLDLDDRIGTLTLFEGVEIPANGVFVMGGEIKKGRKKDTFIITELALIEDKHYKEFLDAMPDSCVQIGGHVKDGKGRCQICFAVVPV